MLGLAQKMFLEKGGKLKPTHSSKKQTWPLLDKLLQQQLLPYIDYALAENIHSDVNESLATLVCYMSMALRSGHLCVKIDKNEIFPYPKQILDQFADSDTLHKISDEDIQSFHSHILKGSQTIPETIIRFDNLYYFSRYWQDETAFIEHFAQIFNGLPTIQLNLETVRNHLLLPEQMQAIQMALSNRFSVICGGPGTGKTYTAGQLIKIYWEALTQDQKRHSEIVLAAPTGKAAANLQRSISQAIANLDNSPDIQAKTLHSLLKIRSSKYRNEEVETLSADLIIIDESSMIDVSVFSRLMMSLKPGSRLILLGDPFQLPPVSVGMLFADLVKFLQQNHPDRITLLEKCLRTDLKGIVDFANTIKEANIGRAQELLKDENPGVAFTSLNSQTFEAQKSLLKYATPFFSKFNRSETSPEKVLKEMNHFRILSPLRQGPFGVDVLNDLFAKQLRSSTTQIAPIMLLQNDSRLDLFNGEVGVLVKRSQHDDFEAQDYALFEDSNGDIKKINALLLPQYEYAYCISVHKSQGSEFDHVLVLLPEGSEVFGREMLYTAATRARKQLEVWSDETTFANVLKQESHRMSGLSVRLKSETSKDLPSVD